VLAVGCVRGVVQCWRSRELLSHWWQSGPSQMWLTRTTTPGIFLPCMSRRFRAYMNVGKVGSMGSVVFRVWYLLLRPATIWSTRVRSLTG